MMEALLATLERDAEAEVARVLTDARNEAAAIAKQADDALSRRRAETTQRREAARRAALDQALAAARQTAQRRVLTARERLLARVFAALAELLPTLARTAEYRAALPREVARALRFTGPRPAVLWCAPAEAARLRRAVQRNGDLAIRPDRAVRDGFRVATADGAVEVDGTLAGRLARLRPRLALEALAAFLAPR